LPFSRNVICNSLIVVFLITISDYLYFNGSKAKHNGQYATAKKNTLIANTKYFLNNIDKND
jgi:hypothetical protein